MRILRFSVESGSQHQPVDLSTAAHRRMPARRGCRRRARLARARDGTRAGVPRRERLGEPAGGVHVRMNNRCGAITAPVTRGMLVSPRWLAHWSRIVARGSVVQSRPLSEHRQRGGDIRRCGDRGQGRLPRRLRAANGPNSGSGDARRHPNGPAVTARRICTLRDGLCTLA